MPGDSDYTAIGIDSCIPGVGLYTGMQRSALPLTSWISWGRIARLQSRITLAGCSRLAALDIRKMWLPKEAL